MSDAAPNGWPTWVLRGFREGQRRALAEVYRLHVDEVMRRRDGFAYDSAGMLHRFFRYRSGFELHAGVEARITNAVSPRRR